MYEPHSARLHSERPLTSAVYRASCASLCHRLHSSGYRNTDASSKGLKEVLVGTCSVTSMSTTKARFHTAATPGCSNCTVETMWPRVALTPLCDCDPTLLAS